jgi:hypothetical protein
MFEIRQRIDYLAQFLIPHGQKLLLNTEGAVKRKFLKRSLKTQFKILRTLEKRRTKALYFYQVALLAGRVPKALVPGILENVMAESDHPRFNCHRMVKRCLATLITNGSVRDFFKSVKNPG